MNNKSSYWSCESVQSAVYLAPDEIRTCCKRFWYDGEFKGDVVIIPAADPDNVSPRSIISAKQNLISKINSTNASACTGCPWLTLRNWDEYKPLSIRHISLEYHSLCNLRCSYCSDIYYSGKKASYNILMLLEQLKKNQACEGEIDSIVWGGGEPVLSENFKPVLQYIEDNFTLKYFRIFTNSFKFSSELKMAVDSGIASITTSIDAGDSESFHKIRGVNCFDKVISNLVEYSKTNPKNVTVKYILSEENTSTNELETFLSVLLTSKLNQVNLQISLDFKGDSICSSIAMGGIYLYCKAKSLKFNSVFFDDLFIHRLKDFDKTDLPSIVSFLKLHKLDSYLLNSALNVKEVVVYGAGEYSVDLLKNTQFFKNVNVAYFVDRDPSKQVSGHLGRCVYHPNKLLDSGLPIVIASAQTYSSIFQDLLRLGISRERILKGLIL